MSEYIKINHTLPDEVRSRIAELKATLSPADWKAVRSAYATTLRRAGWTLQSISELFDWTRERVRQVASNTGEITARTLVEHYGLPVPELPKKPVRVPPTYVEPSAETLARLLELKPMAMAVRSNSPAFRVEAEEYTRLLDHAHRVEGVTLYRLAKRLGVTHGAIRFRLARYGYKLPKNASSKVYQPILDKNRVR
jgi:glycine/D-amino acid oxidase-like deaminating enzyme